MLSTILDILLPPRCISCGALVKEPGALCGKCWAEIDFITSPMCVNCGFPLESTAKADSLCGHCIAEPPQFDKGRAVFCYNDKSRKIITDYKYSDKIGATERFAQWLKTTSGEILPEVDVIVPVPLHWKRLLARKYNQAALISNALSRITQIKSEPRALVRKKNIPPQASLSRRNRLKNVKGAFAAHRKYGSVIKENNVLLVDDVFTTGATINECARVLKKAGADKVFVVTLARTVEGN